MKFTTYPVICALTMSALSTVNAIRGNDGDTKDKSGNRRREGQHGPERDHRALKSEGKNGKGKGIGDSCPTCSESLPGYSFFGQNYLDKDFWDNAIDKAFGNRPFGSYTALPTGTCFQTINGPPVTCGTNEARFGEDFLVPGPFGGSTDGISCYDNRDSFRFCTIVAGLAELLYTNDLFRCLLTSLVTTVRDLTCLEKLPQNRRKLEEVTSRTVLSNEDLLLNIPALTGWTKFEDIEAYFGINVAKDLLGQNGAVGRMLAPDIRKGGDTAADIVNEEIFDIDGLLDVIYRDSDNVQAIRGNLFLARCQDSISSLGLCAGLFALLKTIDASVCYYRTELGCGTDTCTKDLAFDVAYNTERLVLDLPLGGGPSSLIIADILSPCDACILEKSKGCSAFCNLFESYHTCDNVNGAFTNVIENDSLDDFARFVISDFLEGE